MIGQTLGHYRIVEKIGEGGMGVVYRARDEQLDRDVALKVLPPGTLAKLNHPNIETVYEFGSQDGVDFLVMELIPGCTLTERLRLGSLPEKEVLRLSGQLAEGLVAAHEQGVVHRDLKPSNLLITPAGRLKILDFGLAKLFGPAFDEDLTQTLTETQSVSGTLPYMSPEQLRGEPADARSDLYATGAVLYEMVTGQRPFMETQAAQLIYAILHRNPQPPTAVNYRVSPILERTIVKALDKEPQRRD